MNIWHDIDPERINAKEFAAVVEISKGSKNKYELDKQTGLLKLDRVLYTSTHYPANYGFIPHTLSLDGDPLDVLIVCQENILPMTLVQCKPLGVLNMTDCDESDEKIIAVPTGDPAMNCYDDLDQIPEHVRKEIAHFFEVYKNLEGKKTSIDTIGGKSSAQEIILRSIAEYEKKLGRALDN